MPSAANTTRLKALQEIPGVGKQIAQDLWSLNIQSVSDLRDRDPEQLYHALCELQGTAIDRCMLYVFRCAVYYASTDQPDPVLLKWWSWSDKNLAEKQVIDSHKVPS